MRERDGWGLDAAVAVALAVAIFAAWPTAHHYDDGAIYERFVAHAARGEWSTYDATQGPVAGMSGLLHGLAASALAASTDAASTKAPASGTPVPRAR